MYKYTNEQVNLPLKRLQTVGFIEEDVEVHKDLFSYDVYRKAFGDENGVLEDYNLRFVGPKIVNTKDVSNDGQFDRAQVYRAGANPENQAILASIKKEGYALNEIPPAVILNPETGELSHGDGRTRYSLLNGPLGVKNYLVNCYELLSTDEKEVAKSRRFGMMMNTLGKSKGKATEEDVVTFLTSQAKKPAKNKKSQLELLYGEMNTFHDFKRALNGELKTANMSLSTQKTAQLASELFEKFYGKRELITFKDADDCLEYVRDKWGPEWFDNEERVVTCVAADGRQGLNTYLDQLVQMRKRNDTRRLDVVLFETEPSSANPERQFNTKMMQAKSKMLHRLETWSTVLFGGAEVQNLNVLAAVPYVASLNDQYPLEKPLYL